MTDGCHSLGPVGCTGTPGALAPVGAPGLGMDAEKKAAFLYFFALGELQI